MLYMWTSIHITNKGAIILKDNKQINFCDESCINARKIPKENIYNQSKIVDMAEFFKVFGDPTRLKIINILMNRSICVCEMADFIGMNQSAISHQLRILKQSRLVKYERKGKVIYYSLDDEHIREIFEIGAKHLKESWWDIWAKT